MEIRRIVSTSFWTDDDIIERFSPEDKYFYLYLMTNPHTTQLGVYLVTFKQMAFETGFSAETIPTLIDRFQNTYGVIKYSNTTREIAIKNYLRYSIMKGGKPVFDLLMKEMALVQDKSLLRWVHDSLKQHDDLNETVKSILPYLAQEKSENSTTDESYHESSPVEQTNRTTNRTTNRRSSTQRIVALQGDNERMINERMINEKMKNDYQETEREVSIYTQDNCCRSLNAGAQAREDDTGDGDIEDSDLRQESEDNLEAFNRFVKEWGIQTRALRNYSGGKLAGIDWDAISERVGKSDYLQKQKAVSFYIDHADEILDGKYFDYVKPRGSPKSDSRSQSENEDGYIDPERDGSSFANIVYE